MYRSAVQQREHGQVSAEYAVGVVAATTIASGVFFAPDATIVRRVQALMVDIIGRSFGLALPDLFGWPW